MRAQGHGQRLRRDGLRPAPRAGWQRVAAATATALALALAPGCGSDEPADLGGQADATATTPPPAGAGAETLTSPSGSEDGGSGGSGGRGTGDEGGAGSGGEDGGSGGGDGGGSGGGSTGGAGSGGGSGGGGSGSGGSGGSGSGSGSGSEGGDADDDSEVGDTLPKKPQEDERKAPDQPTVEIEDGRCTPRSVRVPAQSSLRIRNRDRREARFDVPDAGTKLEVPARGQLQALLPPGRHAYTCRVGGRTSRGTVTVARPG